MKILLAPTHIRTYLGMFISGLRRFWLKYSRPIYKFLPSRASNRGLVRFITGKFFSWSAWILNTWADPVPNIPVYIQLFLGLRAPFFSKSNTFSFVRYGQQEYFDSIISPFYAPIKTARIGFSYCIKTIGKSGLKLFPVWAELEKTPYY